MPDDPKPPNNTISSVVRILNKKGYSDFKAYGKTYEYYPAISKIEYRKFFLKKLIAGYFDNSPATLFSFIVEEDNLSDEDVEKLKKIINKSWNWIDPY